ncbi:MAG: putative Ig domain-containing protein [Myxococcota bacterium]
MQRHMTWIMAITVLGTVGCGEEVFQSLVDFREATTEECASGGQVVITGLDRNENGSLDTDEVDVATPVCNGAPGVDGDQGIPGTNALLRTSDEPEGENCPDGGVKIEVGLDENGNGTLDTEEISATSFVCDGAEGIAGLNSLVATLPDAASCGDAGGITIISGLDDDRDGVLSESEIDDEQVICNGEDGVNSLLEVVPEAPGPNCTAGGQQLTSGLDEDGNGLLEGVEIDDVVYVCDPVANLVTVSPELEGVSTDCPDGGSRIEAGLDLNGDGTLEASEIATTTFVCNGDDGLASLVVVSEEPAGDNCASGGSRVDSGLDLNEDDALDIDEITSSQFICDGIDGVDGADGLNGTDGLDGSSALVRVATEPPGANCAGGGTRVEGGLDVNGNDVLDAGEVTDTSFTCNGEDGTNGTDGIGLTSLVDVTPVAPGADCVNGGQRIDVGLDADSNGVLDMGEVSSSTFVCNGLASVPFAITTGALSDGLANAPYTADFTAIGGTGGDYVWTISAGALPPGLTLDPNGTPTTTLSGTPAVGGTFTFTVQVSDFFGQAADASYTLEVAAPLLEVRTFAVPRPILGAPYSQTLSATGGTAPYTWSITEGTLPAGLTLSAGSGEVSGTPMGGLPATVLITVQDAAGTTRATRLTFHDEPRWAAFGGEFNTDAVNELGLNSIFGGVVGATTTLNPAPVMDGDLGQTTAASISDVKFSVNGDRISFLGDFDVDGAEEIWWVDLSGPTPGVAQKANVAFTATTQDVTAHEWSPDGRFLAYLADDVNDSELNLFLVDTAAPMPTAVQVNPTLQTDQDVFSGFAFSPDSTLLAYEADTSTTNVTDVFVVDLTAVAPAPVNVSNNGPSADTLTFEWSDDSQALLFTSDSNTDGVNELYRSIITAGVPGPAVRVNAALPSFADVNTVNDDYGFSPDGELIFYIADANLDGLFELFVVDAATLGTARLVSHPGLTSTSQDVEFAKFTQDSRSLVFASDGLVLSETELFIGDATGTLTTGPLRLSGPMVSGGDIGQTTVPSVNDALIDPQNRGVFYAADEITDAREDLFFVAFGNPGISTLLSTNLTSSSSDVNSFLVSQDGSIVMYNGDPTVDVDQLFAIDLTGAVPGAPNVANLPLVASGDVDTSITSSDWFIIGDGEAVAYIADAETDAVDEAYYTALSGATAGATTKLNPVLPSGGDCTIVFREN